MRRRRRSSKSTLVVGILIGLMTALPGWSQTQEEVLRSFIPWAQRSLHRVNVVALDESTRDLEPVEEMVGQARIVELSEGIHGGAEPLVFRNRLFKHLVTHMGFDAIALESGVVEGRLLNDYVTEGAGEFETVLAQGFSNGFGIFQQNRDLLRWMRDYNAHLPSNQRRVQIYGLDVPGSPGNFDAARRPDTALQTVLEYLRNVDGAEASRMQSRVEEFLPVLRSIDGYGSLSQAQRDSLTATVADLGALMERQTFAYIARSSAEDFEWAERAAIGARQADTWFRTMPLNWKPSDGLAWTRYAMQVRDRTMADNLEWVRSRLNPRSRILVFAAIGHVASTTQVQVPLSANLDMIPLGAYVKERHGNDVVNILNLVANGEISYCSATPPRPMPLRAAPEPGAEALFGSLGVPSYLIDLRRAPPPVSHWLRQVHDHWNGFGSTLFPTSEAYDLVYFVSPMTPACAKTAMRWR